VIGGDGRVCATFLGQARANGLWSAAVESYVYP